MSDSGETTTAAVVEMQDRTTFDIRDIMSLLAHRAPFLLVDRVVDYKKGVSITVIKNVTFNEPFFPGHFPGAPIMPGVLMLEAMAQSAGLLAALDTGIRPDSGALFFFAGIDNARFKRMVTPGDRLTFDVTLGKVKRHMWQFHVVASVDGALACEADLLCAIKK